jgi:hypothetical protein
MSFYIPFGDSQVSGFKLLAYLQTSGTPTGTLTATLYLDDMLDRYNATYTPSPILSQPLQTVTVSGASSSFSWVTATFSTPLIGGDYYWVRFSSTTGSGDPYVIGTNEGARCGCWIKSLSGQNVTIDAILDNYGNNIAEGDGGPPVYFEVNQTEKANEVNFAWSDRAYDPNNITVSIEYPNDTVMTTALISRADAKGDEGVPIQFAQTITLLPGIKYKMVFSNLPLNDGYGDITQDFYTDYANPASAGYLGQGSFPIFQILYQTINYPASNFAAYSPSGITDMFDSPGYHGSTGAEDAIRFVPTQNENLQSITVEVIKTDAISEAILNVTLNTDSETGGSHPTTTAIAQATATLTSINSSFKAGPTNSGYYAWVNMTFTAKPGYTLALTGGMNYWIVLASPQGYFVGLNRLMNPWREPMYCSQDGGSSWGQCADGPSSFSYIIHTSGETYNNAELGSGEYEFQTGNGFAQSFESPTSFQLKGVQASTSFTSRYIVTMSIQTDSGTDSPSGHMIDEVTSVGGTDYFQFPVNITASVKYWIVYSVKCLAPCSNPARVYYGVYGLGQNSILDYGGTSLHYEYLTGSTWTSPPYSERGDMSFLLIGTDVTVHVYNTKTLYDEIVAEDAQSSSYTPSGWNQFLNYEQAQINYNLTQMMSTISGRTFVWLTGLDPNVITALPNVNYKYILGQSGGLPNTLAWSSFGAIGDNLGDITPEGLTQQYLATLPQIGSSTSILTANDWCWGLSCHGVDNFTQTAPMRAFGTILDRMVYTGGYYGTSAATLKVLWIWVAADEGTFPSHLSSMADITLSNSETDSNLTQYGNLQQFNVIVDPQNIQSMTASAEARIVAFVKAGGGIVETSPPATWEDHIMGLTPTTGCCTAPYTVLSGNAITKPYTSLPGYSAYWTSPSFTKESNESAILDVTDANGYAVVSSNNYFSGRGVFVDMPASRLSYVGIGNSYITLLMNSILYAAHQKGPAVWQTSYSTAPWNQIIFSVDGSPGYPLLWVSSNSTSSQTFSINLNATYYGITGSWVAINMQSMAVVGSGSGSSSDIAVSTIIGRFTWAPIYIISRPANLKPVYSTTSITNSSISSSGGQYATSGPHNASSWLILSMASLPLSVTSSKSSEQLPAFSTLSALNFSKIGDYCTSIASGGGCDSFTYMNQQGWYYDSSSSLLYIHFQQGSPVTIDVTLNQSSSTTSTETASSSYNTTTSTTSTSSTSTTTSLMTTSKTTTVASSTVTQTTSSLPTGCEQTPSCNPSLFYSTITIQSNAVNPVQIYVDAMAYMTPASFTWPVGSNHTLTLGELSVSTPTGRSRFVGWSGGINSTSQSLAIEVESDMSLRASYRNQYLVNVTFADAEGRSVSPQDISIQGPSGAFDLTSPGLWLYSGSYQVTQAEWMGTNVASSPAVPVTFAVTDSKTIVVPLPIYDETIKVTDVYGLPISGANVTMTVGNRIEQLSTNSNGLAVFRQVPLGYLNGTVKYLGFSGNVRVSTPGEHTEYVVVTLSYPLLITVFSVLAVATFFAVRRARRKPVRNSDLYSWKRANAAHSIPCGS